MRAVLYTLCLLLILLAGACSSSSDSVVGGPSAAGSGTLVIDHRLQGSARSLTPDVTHLRVTGFTRNLQAVTLPAVVRERGDVVTVQDIPLTTRVVQVDYLNGDEVAGTYSGVVRFQPGQAVTLTNPHWVGNCGCFDVVDDELGQYGASQQLLTGQTSQPVDPAAQESDPAPRASVAPISSPAASCSPTAPPQGSPLDLYAFQSVANPVALPPNLVAGSLSFGPSPSPLPPRLTLSNLPPVGTQGTATSLGYPGTCIAWSFGYGLGSYTAARNPQGAILHNLTAANAASFLASPMYLYEMAINLEPGQTANCGGSGGVYLPFLVGYGAAPLAAVPYHPDCAAMRCGAQTVQLQPPNPQLALGSYGTLLQGKPATQTTVDLVKQFLGNQQAVGFAVLVPYEFKCLQPIVNGAYVAPTSPSPKGGHGMLIVGYDDTLGTQGAFLVQNSFNTTWPDPELCASPSPGPTPSPGNGLFYLAYESFELITKSAAVGFPVSPSPPAGVNLTSSGSTTAIISSPYQVTEGANTTLVLNHWFSQPSMVWNVTLTEPGSNSTVQVTNPLGYPLRNGYTYLVRSDGASFLPGTYGVRMVISSGFRAGRFVYDGNVTVSSPFPQPSPKTMAALTMTGTTGVNVTASAPIGQRTLSRRKSGQ